MDSAAGLKVNLLFLRPVCEKSHSNSVNSLSRHEKPPLLERQSLCFSSRLLSLPHRACRFIAGLQEWQRLVTSVQPRG